MEVVYEVSFKTYKRTASLLLGSDIITLSEGVLLEDFGMRYGEALLAGY